MLPHNKLCQEAFFRKFQMSPLRGKIQENQRAGLSNYLENGSLN